MNKSKNQGNRRGFLSKILVMGAGSVAFLTSSAYTKGKSGGKIGSVKLTEKQKGKLFFIYQEEKVARDVYITLGKQYKDENTFASIQLSEQRHIDAARGLCEKYDVDISEVVEDSVGEFEIDILQTLYDSCVLEEDVDTLPKALLMGIIIEETDIHDLEVAMSDEFGMPDDVIRVYGNLLEGSFNHLEAFETAIAR